MICNVYKQSFLVESGNNVNLLGPHVILWLSQFNRLSTFHPRLQICTKELRLMILFKNINLINTEIA
jgi:hypothetical protein